MGDLLAAFRTARNGGDSLASNPMAGLGITGDHPNMLLSKLFNQLQGRVGAPGAATPSPGPIGGSGESGIFGSNYRQYTRDV